MAKSRSSSPKWLVGALVSSLAVGAGYGGYRIFGSGSDDDSEPRKSSSLSRDRGENRESAAKEWLERASGQQGSPLPRKEAEPTKSPLSFPSNLFGGSEQKTASSPSQGVKKKKKQSRAKPSKYAQKGKKRGTKTANLKKKSKKKKISGKKSRSSKRYAQSKLKKSKYAKTYKSKKKRHVGSKSHKSQKKLASHKRHSS